METDAPIYLLFTKKDSNRCVGYVIEEKTTTAAAPVEGLRDDLLWRISEHDAVRDLCLPNLDYSVVGSNHVSMVVSNSRIFFIGGITWSGPKHKGITYPIHNGIIYIDLLDKGNEFSWKRCDRWAKDFERSSGAVYDKQDDQIYVFSRLDRERVLRFDCRDVEAGKVLRVPDFCGSQLVASTDDETLMCKRDYRVRARKFQFFQMKSSSLTRSSGDFRCFDALPLDMPCQRNVLVEEGDESYVVCFLKQSPLKIDDCYCRPGLYVYHIQRGRWLPKVVQELPNDGITLPPLGLERLYEVSLMRVNVDKLALVWAMETHNGYAYTGETEVHWSKFKLVRKVDDDNTVCFYCDILSYGSCSGGGISNIISCATDVGEK